MMTKEQLAKTLNVSGGAYSEIYYFDKDGKPADKSQAVRCVIRECAENGDLINEIWGALSSRIKEDHCSDV